MKWLLMLLVLGVIRGEEECLHGTEFLNGIRTIIGADPNLPRSELQYKPFVGSFSTIKSEDDKSLATTKYCMTDNACGHWDAYSRPDVPLSDLGCNSFCYISRVTGRFAKSSRYSPSNPPSSYLNCGWETCG